MYYGWLVPLCSQCIFGLYRCTIINSTLCKALTTRDSYICHTGDHGGTALILMRFNFEFKLRGPWFSDLVLIFFSFLYQFVFSSMFLAAWCFSGPQSKPSPLFFQWAYFLFFLNRRRSILGFEQVKTALFLEKNEPNFCSPPFFWTESKPSLSLR